MSDRFKVNADGDSLIIIVDGTRVTLTYEYWGRLSNWMVSSWHNRRHKREREESNRKQSSRWLLDRDGAEWRESRGQVVRAKLKRVMPRREWQCATCHRELIEGRPHWRPVEFECNGMRVPEPKHYFNTHITARFCDQCVHAAKSNADTLPWSPRGLKLVSSE